MKESLVERHLVQGVKALGGLCYKFTSPGTLGVPDRIIILQGLVLFVELKTTKGRISKIQAHTIQEIQNQGGLVITVKGLEEVKSLLGMLEQECQRGEETHDV